MMHFHMLGPYISYNCRPTCSLRPELFICSHSMSAIQDNRKIAWGYNSIMVPSRPKVTIEHQ